MVSTCHLKQSVPQPLAAAMYTNLAHVLTDNLMCCSAMTNWDLLLPTQDFSSCSNKVCYKTKILIYLNEFLIAQSTSTLKASTTLTAGCIKLTTWVPLAESGSLLRVCTLPQPNSSQRYVQYTRLPAEPMIKLP